MMNKLYSLIIVDDEPSILNGLVSTYDWEDMGYKVIGSARTGTEALRLAIERKPDVILSDIRMKDMDGLSLVQNVKREGLDIKFVLMSAYKDFEYAKLACDLGVFAFLTKVFSDEEINQVMQSLYKVIEENERKNRRLDLINENEVAITSNILRNFLLNEIEIFTAEEELTAIGRKFNKNAMYCCICVNTPLWMDSLTSEMRFNAISRFCEGITIYYETVQLELKDGVQVLIIKVNNQLKNFEINLENKINDILNKIEKYNCHIICSIGGVFEGLDGIQRSFMDAFSSLRKTRYGMGIAYQDNVRIISSSTDVLENSIIIYDNDGTDYIKQAIKMIEAEIQEGEVSIKDIAQRLHLNPMYFGRLFKHRTGTSFNKYVLMQRIKLAKMLLASRDYNITEVGYKVGFNSISYFTAQFKKYTSMLPSEFKQNAQENKNV